MIQPVWTNITSGLLDAVKIIYQKNEAAGCHYHNWNHICECYTYLFKKNTPYDINLDFAVLFHDVVYDHLSEKELRSADFAIKAIHDFHMFGHPLPEDYNPDIVRSIIMGTVTHSVTTSTIWQTRAMVHADLSGLTDLTGLVPLKNYANIARESVELYHGLTMKEYCENNLEFMKGFYRRMLDNIGNDPGNSKFYSRVIKGIQTTLTLSDAMIVRYNMAKEKDLYD